MRTGRCDGLASEKSELSVQCVDDEVVIKGLLIVRRRDRSEGGKTA